MEDSASDESKMLKGQMPLISASLNAPLEERTYFARLHAKTVSSLSSVIDDYTGD